MDPSRLTSSDIERVVWIATVAKILAEDHNKK
jgi:hypothetical protein